MDWSPPAGDLEGRGPSNSAQPSPPHYPYCSFPGKIEIKIVRPGAEGNEEDTRWLTDEDTKNLKEIFFNILVRHPTHVLGPQLPALCC